MKKLMTIMMAIVIAATSFNVAPVQTASAIPDISPDAVPDITPTVTPDITSSAAPTVTASVTPSIAPLQTAGVDNTGQRVLYTTGDRGDGYGTRAILSTDKTTICYQHIFISTGKTEPYTTITLLGNGFCLMRTTNGSIRYKILENNDYRLKLEDQYGKIYLMDDSNDMTKISEGNGTPYWMKKSSKLSKEIGIYKYEKSLYKKQKHETLVNIKGAAKVANGYTIKIALLGSDRYKKYNNGEDPLVTWTSSDPSIATIDNHGVVTGKAEGSVTMTAQYADYDPVSITVNVVKNEYKKNIKNSHDLTELQNEPDGCLTNHAITSMKWDKNGNLNCIYERKTFYPSGKPLKKKGKRYTDKVHIKIQDKDTNVVYNKSIKFKNIDLYNCKRKIVIKKKNLKKKNFDLIYAVTHTDIDHLSHK